jgi:hypothetical protein
MTTRQAVKDDCILIHKREDILSILTPERISLRHKLTLVDFIKIDTQVYNNANLTELHDLARNRVYTPSCLLPVGQSISVVVSG